MLQKLDAEPFEIRQKRDLEQPFDGLILPGGESTTMGKLLRELDLLEDLRMRIAQGLPVLGTCAGLILLAEKIANDAHTYFGTLPVTVQQEFLWEAARELFPNGGYKGNRPVSAAGVYPRALHRSDGRGRGSPGGDRWQSRWRAVWESNRGCVPSRIDRESGRSSAFSTED